MVCQLTIYSNTSINDALKLPVSIGGEFFKSKAFENWKKHKEAENKLQSNNAIRLNNIIRAIGNLRLG